MRTDSRAETDERAGAFTPPKPHELAQHFPQLEILDLVGHGGMGAVYKARQRGLDRMVALKILPPEVGQDPSFAERFAREARALAKLSHPNIVGVHDSGIAGGLYYLLMEYVDGVNLREAIQTKELTPEEAFAIVPQICEALQYAHDEGVVHRDIKPENILLDKRGRVKIADFGLARLLGQAQDNFTLTGTNQVMGTPRYMAPEQMQGSHEVDHRADIYSLGVVFYEMLTGELPLGRFDAPSQKVRLDVRVDDVVLRTLQKEPSRRYQHASEIKTDVEAISEYANLAPHVRRMQGCDYRSKTELFGWPLIHVATGIDPKTGRKRIAKGIIAIGDVAVGGIAIGGAAIGVFASGGAAVGLFSFGGAAVGILVAIGGAAAGLGFSCGGFALGSVAMGGLAVGYYGYGGAAFAVHGLSAMGRDPAAVNVFEPWADAFMTGFPILTTIGVLVMVFGMQLIVAIAKRHSVEGPRSPRGRHTSQSSGGAGCAIATVALVLMLGGCLLSGVLLLSWDTSARRVAHLERDQVLDSVRADDAERLIREQSNAGAWELTDKGPVLSLYGEGAYGLRADQIPLVNQILQSIYRAYLEIEPQHMTRETDDLGHLVITISEFPEAEIAKLEESLWTQLDEILDVDQQKRIRANLDVHTGEGRKKGGNMVTNYETDINGNIHAVDAKRWAPGVLGWGRRGARIELWMLGTWFHWKAEIPIDSNTKVAPKGSAPQLPAEFARFWTNNTEDGIDEVPVDATIDNEAAEPQE